MDKVAIYKEHIYKEAASKAQKMINAGKLSEEAVDKLHEAVPLIKNIQNKINARAKRGADDLLPKAKMTAKKYLGVSEPNNLPSRAPIDTKRIMKHQGHENGKAVSELRRQADRGVDISRSKNLPLDGESGMGWDTKSGQVHHWNINIPKKDAKALPDSYGAKASDRSAKELRALTVRHEISGEATSQSRMLRALDAKDYNMGNANLNTFRINNHNNPDVLVGDAKMVKRLSPETQKLFDMKNKHNITGVHNTDINNGKNMNEGQLMNRLRMKFGDDVISAAKDKDITNTPYFKKKLPNSQELKDSMKRMGKLNGVNREYVGEEIADSYMKTPFAYTKRKK